MCKSLKKADDFATLNHVSFSNFQYYGDNIAVNRHKTAIKIGRK